MHVHITYIYEIWHKCTEINVYKKIILINFQTTQNMNLQMENWTAQN